MLTLLFNVLVSASPKEYAGDVGALRGVANNVSSALGAAFAGVVAVGLLTVVLNSAINRSTLPPELNLDRFDRIDFVSDTQLAAALTQMGVTPEQAAEAMQINADARLAALRASFLLLALICLLAIFPAMRLPRYRLTELSAEEIVNEEERYEHPVAVALGKGGA